VIYNPQIANTGWNSRINCYCTTGKIKQCIFCSETCDIFVHLEQIYGYVCEQNVLNGYLREKESPCSFRFRNRHVLPYCVLANVWTYSNKSSWHLCCLSLAISVYFYISLQDKFICVGKLLFVRLMFYVKLSTTSLKLLWSTDLQNNDGSPTSLCQGWSGRRALDSSFRRQKKVTAMSSSINAYER
jgi:hypothetical protein